MDTLTITTVGSCAVGTPNGLTFHKGYVEFWTNDQKLPYKRVWCEQRRLAPETALRDAMNKQNELLADN
jgi:hypothetical protein